MTAAIIIILAIALCGACWFYVEALADLAVALRNLDARKAVIDQLREQLSAATEDRHAVANSAMRGCPAVKWARPQPIPEGADAWYWRAMFAGEPHLFTDEAILEARQRASHLLASGRSISTNVST